MKRVFTNTKAVRLESREEMEEEKSEERKGEGGREGERGKEREGEGIKFNFIVFKNNINLLR